MFRRLSLLVVAVVLAGCAPGEAGGRELTVFAAASLTGTFTELGKVFEAGHPGTRVRFNFGSSATLAQQITQGAPADVFASASPATMKAVTGSTGAAPVTFARNRLEIAVPVANPAGVDGPADLAGPGVKVALCAEQVPCGAAAARALEAAGVKVTPVTLERDVKATLTKVELGEVDAALVYRTDVIAAAGRVTGIGFPEAARAVNDYPIVALTSGLAGEFVGLVRSARGRDVLTGAGFEVP
ncbi:molybdate ABC transporter substrate-binding protein [Nonomuraea sp. SBT364]|uniref:molybdate ABC transporter substrate-binding protein n=1 Tax=Nonomuraea sp. SBT364 TaxID=1580530 RepID=UPI00069E2ADA|nr:molybdate ABC transporter substrate-binding protein [Nonomuraea sp. SBT364]